MSATKKTYSFTLDPETVEMVDKVAADSGLTRSGVVNLCVRASLGGSLTTLLVSLLARVTKVQQTSGAGFDDDDPLKADGLVDSQGVDLKSILGAQVS